MKEIAFVRNAPARHWVGDGFAVRSLFSYGSDAPALTPFLLLDHAAPMDFPPATGARGVGEHPHRGFETVTIVYDGEVEHRDSSGGGGTIGPGDVQWMTAASGIVHDEFHSHEFTRTGGTLEMVQLWVNLPARHKMTAPKYQALKAADIPSVALPGGAGRVRVIAGAFSGTNGPAQTFTPMSVLDVRLNPDREARFEFTEGHTLAMVALQGTVLVAGREIVRGGQLVVFDRSGTTVGIEANNDAKLLILSGEPIDEPVVGHGPFVMNTETQIRQAIDDYEHGRFGHLAA